MYEAFFQLRENPFGPTPDPRFLYKSRGHREALAYLASGVFGKRGFLALTGEVGIGKTTIIRAFVHTFQPCLQAAFVLNTKVNFEEMLYLILRDFGCEVQGTSKVEMLTTLNDFLIRKFAENQNPILFIDEAQNLSPDILEELRMLSNLETNQQKLIQIVIAGQPELEEILHKQEMRQLRQRIPGIARMKPLRMDEIDRYIGFRLSVAGLMNGHLQFSADAQEAIFAYSGGIPRLINMICDRVLVHGYRQRTARINKGLVDEGARDLFRPGAHDPGELAGGER